jgi:hypothetical protein
MRRKAKTIVLWFNHKAFKLLVLVYSAFTASPRETFFWFRLVRVRNKSCATISILILLPSVFILHT